MSLETDQWTSLSQPQTEFFRAQLEAAGQAAFSSVAQEAGIVTRAATRYSMKIEGHGAMYAAIMWPDPYTPHTACIVMQSVGHWSNQPEAFARITVSEESCFVEGVGTRLDHGNKALYGRQHFLHHDLGISVPQIGADFIATAVQRATARPKPVQSPLVPPGTARTTSELTGIQGNVAARLFRSLGSLGATMSVTGMSGEKLLGMDQTYDLASALIKITVAELADKQDYGVDSVLWGASGAPLGTIFESDRYGLTILRRAESATDTILLATASRPKVDEPHVFVEQHLIGGGGVYADIMTLPSDAYDPRTILSALAAAAASAKEADSPTHIRLSSDSCRVLERKIMHLLNERIRQSA